MATLSVLTMAASAADPTETAVVGMLTEFPPHYSLDPDGLPTGFAIEVFEAIAREAGVAYEYAAFDTWPALHEAMRAGEIDVIPNMGITEARREFADFTVPTEVFSLSVFVREDSNYRALKDLSGQVIAVVSSNAAIPLLRARKDYPLREFAHFSEALQALMAVRVDAVAYPTPVVHSTAAEFGIEDRLRPIPPPLKEIRRGIAVAKHHEALLARLDGVTRTFVTTPQYGEIYARWFRPPPPYWSPKRVVAVLFVGMLLSAVVSFAVRYRRITHLVNELAGEKTRFHIIADYTYDWEIWVGANGQLAYVSPSCEEITGYTPKEFFEQPDLPMQIVHPDDKAALQALDEEYHRTHEPVGQVYRITTKDGEQRWIEHRRLPVNRPITDHLDSHYCDGDYCGYRASNRDITDRKAAEEDTAFYATHDALTRLPNRYLLMDRLQNALTAAQRNRTRVALLYIDLDRFKPVNDTLGHAAGDQVLQAVASRLQSSIRESDTAARIGGDEFVAILPNLAGPEALSTVTREMQASLSRPYPLGSDSVSVGISIGVALYPDDAKTADKLLDIADQALYQVKGRGEGGIQYASSPG
jgi:diguanylate cyclase (GGDEF)-like protein/PAS domain S-box-containing protein